MERKEAIEVIKKNYPDSSFTMLREALETLIPELKESEDERIRKELVQFFEEKDEEDFEEWIPKAKVLAWLGKQGEHAKFRDSIQVGDKLTLNEDGVLVNLSQLNRVAKKDEKQGEKPRYSIGDVLCDKSCTTLNKDAQPNFEIVYIKNGLYICDKGYIPISQQDEYELVAKKIEQKPAWSEEDEAMWTEISDLLWEGYKQSGSKFSWDDIRNWVNSKLKSLTP